MKGRRYTVTGMASTFAWPFELASNGTVATVDGDSDQGHAQQLGLLLLTIEGELEMTPGYGIPDPTFSGIKAGVIASQAAQYVPDVTVQSVTSSFVAPSTSDVTVTFQ